jgi:hypothetical protein
VEQVVMGAFTNDLRRAFSKNKVEFKNRTTLYPMEYAAEFERDFIRRTLTLLQEYDGQYNATLLINCFVGLLIVPDEKLFDEIPTDSLMSASGWGIPMSAITQFSVASGKNPYPDTIRGVVHSLRNAVAHSRFTPQHDGGMVIGFQFTDRSGFDATLGLTGLQTFVQRLAAELTRTLT